MVQSCLVLLVWSLLRLIGGITPKYRIAVCGGFTEGGLPGDCCWPEAIGMEVAKLAWDRGAFVGSTHGVLDPPSEGKQNFSVDMSIADLEGDRGKAVLCAINEWTGAQRTPLVVAAGFSSLAIPVATVGPAVQGIQLDWSATSSRLSDKSIYKYYSRLAPSDDVNAKRLATLLTNVWGYRRLMVVYEKGDYGQPLFEKLAAELSIDVSLQTVALPAAPTQADKPMMRDLLDKSVTKLMRIGVLFALKLVTYEVFSEPSYTGTLLRPGNLWVGVPDLITQGWKNLDQQSQLSFKGAMTLGADSRGPSQRIEAFKSFMKTLTVSDMSTEIMRAVVPCNETAVMNLGEMRNGTKSDCWWGGAQVFQNPGDIVDDYTFWAFDALSLAHYAVNRLLAQGTSLANIKDDTLLNGIRDTRFIGLTGAVKIDANGDRTPGSFSITMIVEETVGLASSKQFGSFDPITQVVSWTTPPIYSDGSQARPPDRFALCGPGEVRDPSDYECKGCPKGTFSEVRDSLSGIDTKHCTVCRVGTYAESSSSASCEECPAGQYGNNTGRTACDVCPAGKYKAAGSTPCQLCPVGSIGMNEGAKKASDCKQCSAGKYTENLAGRSNVSDCKPCEPGYALAASFGEGFCQHCMAGMYSDAGQAECTRCMEGSYSNATKQSSCVKCEKGATRYLGSSSPSDCICPSEQYADQYGACKPCLEGMDCPLGSDVAHYKYMGNWSSTYPYPELLSRYWSSKDNPLSVFECESSDRCPGGYPGTCGMRLTGSSCSKCAHEWYWDGKLCARCTPAETSKAVFPGLPILLVPLIICMMYKCFGDELVKWGSWQNACAALLFVGLNHCQMITMLISGKIEYPQATLDVFGFWSFTSDIAALFKMPCTGFTSFSDTILLKSLGPVIIAAMCGATFMLSLVASTTVSPLLKMEANRLLNVYGSVIYTFFGAIAAMSMLLFKCTKNPNDKATLAADFSIVCYESSDWSDSLVIGIFAVLVYVLGCGTLFVYVVLVAANNFNNVSWRMRWKFLFIKYRPDVWWWSLVFLLKNFLLNLGFVVFTEPVAQYMWMFTTTVLYCGLVGYFLPYRHRIVSVLDVMSGVSILYGSSVFLAMSYRQSNGSARDDLALFITGFSFSPLLFMVMAMCSKAFRRKSRMCLILRPGSPPEKDKGERWQAQLRDDIDLISSGLGVIHEMEPKAQMKFLLQLTEWDRWYLSQVRKFTCAELFSDSADGAPVLSTSKSRLCSREFVVQTPSLGSSLGRVATHETQKSNSERETQIAAVNCEHTAEVEGLQSEVRKLQEQLSSETLKSDALEAQVMFAHASNPTSETRLPFSSAPNMGASTPRTPPRTPRSPRENKPLVLRGQ